MSSAGSLGYLVERKEVGTEQLKKQPLVAEPDSLLEVDVSVVEVLADGLHHLLVVLLYTLGQILKVGEGGTALQMTPHAKVATFMTRGMEGKSIKGKVKPATMKGKLFY